MRKMIATTLMTLGLTGGAALAEPHGEAYREAAHEQREVRDVHYRDYHARPAPHFERHEDRRGFRWVSGAWRWNRREWSWTPGYYVRAGR